MNQRSYHINVNDSPVEFLTGLSPTTCLREEKPIKMGIYPKCNSKELFPGSQVPMKSEVNNGNSIPVSGRTCTPLDHYVCGYVESYIAKSTHPEKIRHRWPLADNHSRKIR